MAKQPTSKQIADYYYDGAIVLTVYTCYDGDVLSHYDVYDEGECVNEGNPFYRMPSWRQCKKLLGELNG